MHIFDEDDIIHDLPDVIILLESEYSDITSYLVQNNTSPPLGSFIS